MCLVAFASSMAEELDTDAWPSDLTKYSQRTAGNPILGLSLSYKCLPKEGLQATSQASRHFSRLLTVFGLTFFAYFCTLCSTSTSTPRKRRADRLKQRTMTGPHTPRRKLDTAAIAWSSNTLRIILNYNCCTAVSQPCRQRIDPEC